MSAKHQLYDTRGTCISIINNGLQAKQLNPLLLKTIYTCVVRPKALYGCESLTSCADVDVLKLVGADRFCVKYCQRFDRPNNSNFAHLKLNVLPIQLEIVYRKLPMLGQLWSLPSDALAKQVFVNRLTRFFMPDRQFKGFIPDICSIVRKYGLEEYWDYYRFTSCFPSKQKWKCTLKRAIYDRWQNDTLEILKEKLTENNLGWLISLENCAAMWQTVVSDKKLTIASKAILKGIGLMVTRQFARTCKLCNMVITNEAEHKLSFCLMCEVQRKQLWHTVIDQGGTELFIKLNQ